MATVGTMSVLISGKLAHILIGTDNWKGQVMCSTLSSYHLLQSELRVLFLLTEACFISPFKHINSHTWVSDFSTGK